MSSEIKADKWSPASGTSATIGDSGDTYTIPSGVTLDTNKLVLFLYHPVSLQDRSHKSNLLDTDKFLLLVAHTLDQQEHYKSYGVCYLELGARRFRKW